MLGSLTSLVATEDWHAMQALGQPTRTGRSLPRISPFGIYRCHDGYVSIVAPNDKLAKAVFAAVGQPELASDPRFATVASRSLRDREITVLIENWAVHLGQDEVCRRLEAAGVPCAPVRSPIEAVSDPGVVARGEVEHPFDDVYGEIGELWTMGMPIRLFNSPSQLGRGAPRLGEHDDLIFRKLLGYDEQRIAALRAAGAIGGGS